jgi:hypothetical protein
VRGVLIEVDEPHDLGKEQTRNSMRAENHSPVLPKFSKPDSANRMPESQHTVYYCRSGRIILSTNRACYHDTLE